MTEEEKQEMIRMIEMNANIGYLMTTTNKRHDHSNYQQTPIKSETN